MSPENLLGDMCPLTGNACGPSAFCGWWEILNGGKRLAGCVVQLVGMQAGRL